MQWDLFFFFCEWHFLLSFLQSPQSYDDTHSIRTRRSCNTNADVYPNLILNLLANMFLFSDVQLALTTEPFQMLEAFYLLVKAQLQYYIVIVF